MVVELGKVGKEDDPESWAALFRAGAFAVIFDDKKRVLLAKGQGYPYWNLPGGGVEKGFWMPTSLTGVWLGRSS